MMSELEGNVIMSSSEKQMLEARVSKQAEEISDYKKQLNTKISKLKQVEAMKKMLTDKNGEIKDLREKLSKYEG
jgi:predicted RNase H-like nuclease (RuvC/YqgF family)